jgi:hypothetical protein
MSETIRRSLWWVVVGGDGDGDDDKFHNRAHTVNHTTVKETKTDVQKAVQIEQKCVVGAADTQEGSLDDSHQCD